MFPKREIKTMISAGLTEKGASLENEAVGNFFGQKKTKAAKASSTSRRHSPNLSDRRTCNGNCLCKPPLDSDGEHFALGGSKIQTLLVCFTHTHTRALSKTTAPELLEITQECFILTGSPEVLKIAGEHSYVFLEAPQSSTRAGPSSTTSRGSRGSACHPKCHGGSPFS